MNLLFTRFTWLAISFAPIVGAAPAPSETDLPFNTTGIAGYDPSIEYHGYATAEIWMGRLRTNIGDVTGAELYLNMYDQIQKNCYGGRDGCTWSGEGRIETHLAHSGDKVAESKSMTLESSARSNQHRHDSILPPRRTVFRADSQAPRRQLSRHSRGSHHCAVELRRRAAGLEQVLQHLGLHYREYCSSSPPSYRATNTIGRSTSRQSMASATTYMLASTAVHPTASSDAVRRARRWIVRLTDSEVR
jgi:hypothetical protein